MTANRRLRAAFQLTSLLVCAMVLTRVCQAQTNTTESKEKKFKFEEIRLNERAEPVARYYVRGIGYQEVPLSDELAKLLPAMNRLEDLERMTHSGEQGHEVNSGDELQFSPKQQEKIREAWEDTSSGFVRMAVQISKGEIEHDKVAQHTEKLRESIDAAFDCLLDVQKQRLAELEIWVLRAHDRGLIGMLTSKPVGEILGVSPEQASFLENLKDEIDEEVFDKVDELITKYRQKSIDSLPADIRAKVKALVDEGWPKDRRQFGDFRRSFLELTDF